MEKSQDQRVAAAIEAMEMNLSKRWRVDELAAVAGLSPSRFAHVFRAATGTSPLRYVHDLRLTRARHLLERTTFSVQEVMTLVGCTDASHFARAFRQRFGVAPRFHRHEHHRLTARWRGRG